MQFKFDNLKIKGPFKWRKTAKNNDSDNGTPAKANIKEAFKKMAIKNETESPKIAFNTLYKL